MHWLCCVLLSLPIIGSQHIPPEIARWLLVAFEKEESIRVQTPFSPPDHRASSPFITGDGFAPLCQHHCLYRGCNIKPEQVKYGDCIFIEADLFPRVVRDYLPKINTSYVLVGHNGDQSMPDGQDGKPVLGMNVFTTRTELTREFEAGKLLAVHVQNLWWKGYEDGIPRDPYLHCLPIGLENRYNRLGGDLKSYLSYVETNVVHPKLDSFHSYIPRFSPASTATDHRSSQMLNDGYLFDQTSVMKVTSSYHGTQTFRKPLPPLESTQQLQLNKELASFANKPMLLVAFSPDPFKPDRVKALRELGINPHSDSPLVDHSLYHVISGQLSHAAWMGTIRDFPFVLAPFGHGLDTHRAMEIWLMGGVPVMRRSSISSCYDDSDNVIEDAFTMASSSSTKHQHVIRRGSLPVVIVDHWHEVNRSRLLQEYARIYWQTPRQYWDYRRLFWYQWAERIRGVPVIPASSPSKQL